MDDLTKEQKHLLVSMYKEVLNRQPALSMEDANKFDDSDQLIELFSLNASSDYVSDLCWKLHSKGYIQCYSGDDLANDISLSDKTIVCMENRFKNGLKDVLSFLSNFFFIETPVFAFPSSLEIHRMADVGRVSAISSVFITVSFLAIFSLSIAEIKNFFHLFASYLLPLVTL